jgi:hypothetical protein
MTIVKNESKKHQTVLRTFRLSSALDDALTNKASRKKIGKNSLIVSILNKYIEWDSTVEDFSYLTVPYQMIAKLIDSLDKDTIDSVAKQVSKSAASSIPVWFGSSNLESLLKYMETSIKYTGARVQQRIEKEGNITRIIQYQPFDENGATWARAFNTV